MSFSSKSTPCSASVLMRDALRFRSNANSVPVLAISVPFVLEDGPPAAAPGFSPQSSPPIHMSTTIASNSESHAAGIAWAVKEGFVVDIHANVNELDEPWDDLEGVVGKAMDPNLKNELNGRVVICNYILAPYAACSSDAFITANVLPPAHTLSLPIVKLLTHPTYLAYQKHIAVLSLFPNVYVKFLPPAWDEPTPKATPKEFSKEAKEWKRRIKMYRKFGHFLNCSERAPLTCICFSD